jgi:hypothetical protein
VIFLLLAVAGIVALSIFLSRRKGEGSLTVGPEWGDWNPGS